MPLRKVFPEEAIMELLQRSGLTLWDFGFSQTIFPVYDEKARSYLTSTLLVIKPMEKPAGDTIRLLPIEWWRDAAPATEVLEYAARNFAALSTEVKGGDPIPRHWKEEELLAKLQEETKT